MRHSTLFRFFVVSFLAALVLGIASFFGLREMNESSLGEVRRNMILFTAQNLENEPSYVGSLQALRARSDRRFSGNNLWVISERGEIISGNRENAPPIEWHELKKPLEVHDFTFHFGFFKLVPDFALVKLKPEGVQDAYLLIGFRRPGPYSSGAGWVQVVFLLFILGVSALIAVSLIYIYLRNKSKETRLVLSRLEKGDLKARFEINRVDEIGSLMMDFNRMASEIERLVHRVQETEMARKNLLEELSHDLRTPLTSLNTSVETLATHWEEMPRTEQREFVSVIQTELSYFLSLIEDLFFIAAIGEPRYKKTTEKVDLFECLQNEVWGRSTSAGASSRAPIKWEFAGNEGPRSDTSVRGDPLLLQRLFKNALDNAARYASNKVRVSLQLQKDWVAILIEDDGAGISEEEIQNFGQRRKNRLTLADSVHGVSLGLGSVIMRTILELHGGRLVIERKEPGTQLSLLLPKISAEEVAS